MAPTRNRQTMHATVMQDISYPAAISYLAAAEDMSRTDSGYHSNQSNLPGYYGGELSSILCEEADEFFQYDDDAMNWSFQYNTESIEAASAYNQQQESNYIVGAAGSQMADFFHDDSNSMPRTAYPMTMDYMYGPGQDIDLDDDFLHDMGQQNTQHWPAYLHTLPQIAQEMTYHAGAGSSNNNNILSSAPQGNATRATAACSDMAKSPVSPVSNTRSMTTQHLHTPVEGTVMSTHSGPSTDSGRSETTTGNSALPASTSTSTSNRFPCLMPQCQRQFNRAADLDRHMKFIHCKASVRAMLCDYRRCTRHTLPFHRADHFRDHLRDQHKEDLLKRGETAPPAQSEWWRERSGMAVYGGWWRCSKCFARVGVEAEGWQCEGCGNWCEEERRRVRELPRTCGYEACCTGEGNGERGEEGGASPAAGGKRWVCMRKLRDHLREVHGEDVLLREGKEGEKELADPAWLEGRDWEVVRSQRWRCTRCLRLVDGTADGWECPACGFGCEESRRRWRRRVA